MKLGDIEEGFLGSICAFAGNGLLIFRDINSVDVHEDYGWDQPVHAVSDSVYFCVQNPVDGPVSVEVYEADPDELDFEGVVYFDGAISSTQGQFVLHDPGEDIKLKVTTDRPGPARLRIVADDESLPEEILIQIWYQPSFS